MRDYTAREHADSIRLFTAALAVGVALAAGSAAGAQPQQQPSDQADTAPEPPLVRAVLTGSLDDIKKALAEGADVNLPAGSGVTPLAAAALQGKVDVIEVLVAAGANVNDPDQTGHHSTDGCGGAGTYAGGRSVDPPRRES